uniref:PAXX non-homologous end joining factor n=1 Tax=Macaca fascicularis TaxID=9541 RepID=A0A2K5UMD4_MACFA
PNPLTPPPPKDPAPSQTPPRASSLSPRLACTRLRKPFFRAGALGPQSPALPGAVALPRRVPARRAPWIRCRRRSARCRRAPSRPASCATAKGGKRGGGPRRLQPLKARFGLSAAEDITPRFRAACEQQAVALTLQEDRASLTLSGGPSALAFDLSKVPGPEAASRLQALTLGLAKRVWSLERRLAAAEETAASPRKSPRPAGPQLFLPDPDPQRGGPGPGVRRRCPGESLINPGFKSKKPAGGVDFDET